MVLTEALQLVMADSAGHGWDVVDIGLLDHGRHGRVGITGLELTGAVCFPQGGKIVRGHRTIPRLVGVASGTPALPEWARPGRNHTDHAAAPLRPILRKGGGGEYWPVRLLPHDGD